jgi:ankyrin repeat protein
MSRVFVLFLLIIPLFGCGKLGEENKSLILNENRISPAEADFIAKFKEKVNAPIDNEEGSYPLHIACKNGFGHAVKILLDKGASVNAGERNWPFWSSLHYAAQQGNIDIVRMLLERGADINPKGHRNWMPLHLAIVNGHEAIAKLLIEKGADLTVGAEYNITPLHLAADDGYIEIAKLLISKGANVNAMCWVDGTPLHRAVAGGHLETAKLLIEHGADVNARIGPSRDASDAPLDWCKSPEIRKLLMANGAKTAKELNAKGK